MINFKSNTSFFLISILILIVMLFMSISWGPSNDEKFNEPYADLTLDYYSSFGKNDTVLTTTTKMDPVMKHYGIAIELPAHAIHRWFGIDLYTIRHFFNAFVSFFFILFGALITKRITNSWLGAYIAMAFLIFTPRIFGEAFNNPKDPTYCSTSLASLYLFFVFFDSLPKPSWKKTFLLTLGIAISLLIRISGLISCFLFVIFLSFELYVLYKNKEEIDFKDVFKKLIFAGVVGYLLGIFFWPAMINNPILQPFEALEFLKNLPVTVKNLFEGKYLQSTDIPWYYLPKYFLISNPEIILFGIFLGFGILAKLCKAYNYRRLVFLLISSFFPLFLIIYGKTGLLTGWRHGYFIYIPLVVFSAITFTYILKNFIQKELYRKVLIGLIIIALLPTLFFYIKNYPFFYVYFNPTFGGVKKALGNYELDYYSHSLKPATDWLYENESNLKNLKIASNNTFQVTKILKQKDVNIGVSYIRYRERYDSDWDYALMTQSFVDAEYLKNSYFPPKGTIKTIDVEGVPICAIVKRTDKNDYYGKKALDSGKFSLAVDFLNKAIMYDDKNEIAWSNLGMAQLQLGQPSASVVSFKKSLEISPENLQAMNGLAYAYLNINEINYAKMTLETMIEQNPSYAPAYDLLSKIYANQGNSQMAQQYNNYYRQLIGQ